MCSTDAAIFLRDRYETVFGIFDHATYGDGRPLGLVAMHWCEDVATGSALYERIEQFAELKIKDYFGLSFTEFIDLPTDVCNKMLEVADRKRNVDGRTTDDILNQLHAMEQKARS